MRRIAGLLAIFVLCVYLYTPTSAASLYSCGENAQWALSNGILTVSGSGAMTDYSSTSQIPWYEQRSSITQVVICEGITSIGSTAFAHCANLQIVSLPDTLVSIGNNAFWGCRSLNDIQLPQNMTELGSGAFFQCASLAYISIPDGVTALEASVFAQCAQLDTIALHDNITSIGSNAFSRCYALRHISLPIQLKSIGKHAFFGCAQLSELLFPETLISLAEAPFYGCVNLSVLRFMGSAPEFHKNAFLDIEATVYYPVRNSSWNSVVHCEYGGNISWIGECNHQYEVVHFPPTCTEEGYSQGTCKLCADSYTDLFIPSTGHSFGPWQIIQEPAHSTPGQQIRTCSTCSEVETQQIPPLTRTPGDITGDAEVNNKDLTRLFKYLSGFDVEVMEENVDVNGDGEINNKDLTRLFRYLSGWDVVLY